MRRWRRRRAASPAVGAVGAKVAVPSGGAAEVLGAGAAVGAEAVIGIGACVVAVCAGVCDREEAKDQQLEAAHCTEAANLRHTLITAASGRRACMSPLVVVSDRAVWSRAVSIRVQFSHSPSACHGYSVRPCCFPLCPHAW